MAGTDDVNFPTSSSLALMLLMLMLMITSSQRGWSVASVEGIAGIGGRTYVLPGGTK